MIDGDRTELLSYAETFEKAILTYNHMCEKANNWIPLSADHYSGSALILFRGNEEDCKKIKEFIKGLK